ERVAGIVFKVGVLCSSIAMVYGVYFLLDGALRIVSAPTAVEPTVVLLIPGVTITGSLLLTAIPAFVVVLVTHEFSHKLAAHLHNVRVKSVGVGIFLLLPLAFVEPDEEEFERRGSRARLGVLAAGSYANIVLAILFLLVLSVGYGRPEGVVVAEVVEGGPLDLMTEVGEGDVIVGIGDPDMAVIDILTVDLVPLESVTVYYYEKESIPGLAEPRSVVVTTHPHPDPNESRGIIGYIPSFQPVLGYVLYLPAKIPLFSIATSTFLYQVQLWIVFIGLGVGIFNMLPVFPLDGFSFLKALMERFGVTGSRNKALLYSLMALSLGLLILNLGISYFR
ncbi:MAG: site-2 protease family protein, partial [Candidatus Geothermarchaeales archaeon]